MVYHCRMVERREREGNQMPTATAERTETREITNSEDLIDSRDVIDRIASLQECKDADNVTDYEQEELNSLIKLAEEGEQNTEGWKYGATLIRYSYFENYARDLAEDIGAIQSDQQWPCMYIDWERATDALCEDYTKIDFDGVTYLAR